MVDWVLMLVMAALGIVAFFVLFKSAPESPNQNSIQKTRELAKSKAGAKKEKKREAEKKQAAAPAHYLKLDTRQVQEEDSDVHTLAKVVYNKDQSKTLDFSSNKKRRTASPTQEQAAQSQARSASPPSKAQREEKREQSQKQQARDLQQGFVQVKSKSGPGLTSEQRKEREEARVAEENRIKLRAQERLANDLKKKNETVAVVTEQTMSTEQLKIILDKQKAEKDKANQARKAVSGGRVKNYVRSTDPSPEGEEDEQQDTRPSRSWAPTQNGGDYDYEEEVDEAYPTLPPPSEEKRR
eukprot:NODE_934_length_1223_cov_217.390119_g701_i0.p1 GENE.NODE_934_length_1223_cov_217.390119_g701_i0~~NODE_934_length_1223_cov_217.390119_g701_i0.p1  ORF type:complete len:297 (-),score=65.82 NODE_934_length_1223_cov_217.390119_g701_i0:255-1145(-)